VITFTLARLYESQNHLLEALMMYHYLLKDKDDSELQQKISELTQKIWKEQSPKYDGKINLLFSESDKIKFQIYPQKMFEKMQKIENSLLTEHVTKEIPETAEIGYESEEFSQPEIAKFFSEMESKDFQTIIQLLMKDNKSIENITLKELYQTIHEHYEERR
jgi:hypothetical protein